MSERLPPPSDKKIIAFWEGKRILPDGSLTSNADGMDVVTEDNGDICCFACGYPRKLDKAHIIPHALNGLDTTPCNYFLLCQKCHNESPDTIYEEEFFKWVYRKRYELPILETVQRAFAVYTQQQRERIAFTPTKSMMQAYLGQTIIAHCGKASSGTREAVINHLVAAAVNGTLENEMISITEGGAHYR